MQEKEKKRRQELLTQPQPRTLGCRAFVVFGVFAFDNATILNNNVVALKIAHNKTNHADGY